MSCQSEREVSVGARDVSAAVGIVGRPSEGCTLFLPCLDHLPGPKRAILKVQNTHVPFANLVL